MISTPKNTTINTGRPLQGEPHPQNVFFEHVKKFITLTFICNMLMQLSSDGILNCIFLYRGYDPQVVIEASVNQII